MPKDTPARPRVVVIGAGVIGLQIAKDLLSAGFDVHVIARHFPGNESIDYASPWAGAHFRPHSTASEPRECDWDTQTYTAWLATIEDEDSRAVPLDERSGLALRKSRLLWADDPTASASLWFANKVRDFKVLNQQDLPAGIVSGVQFTSVAVNVPRYLNYLYRGVLNTGAQIVRADIVSELGLTGLFAVCQHHVKQSATTWNVDAIVNATGLGGKVLCEDDRMYPVRGQTVLVRGELHEIRTLQGKDDTGSPYIAYSIPRPGSGTTILGGCNERGSYNAGADPALTAKIMERCSTLCPELLTPDGRFQVVSVQVGLRPARMGGARVDSETATLLQKSIEVVHAYGNGGAGYQNSIGVSKDVLELVKKALVNWSST